MRWAAFCVAFVETFRSHDCARFLDRTEPSSREAQKSVAVSGYPARDAPQPVPGSSQAGAVVSSELVAAAESPSADPGLAALQRAQETATVPQLLQAMRDHIPPECIEWLLADASS